MLCYKRVLFSLFYQATREVSPFKPGPRLCESLVIHYYLLQNTRNNYPWSILLPKTKHSNLCSDARFNHTKHFEVTCASK